MTQIGGLPLIAVKKVELSKPPKKNSNDTVNPVDPLNPVNPDQLIPVMAEPESINKYFSSFSFYIQTENF